MPFSKTRVSIATEDLDRLKKQAKAYRVNQFEIETLRERKKELGEREIAIDERSKRLDEREQ